MLKVKEEDVQSAVQPMPQDIQATDSPLSKGGLGYVKGILFTLVLAVIAGSIAKLPIFSIMGIMSISILLGMGWRGVVGVPLDAMKGIAFSNKVLLRVGIILMGLRLNLEQIISAGFSILLIDVIVIVFTLTLMMSLGKWLSVDRHLAALIAVGTAVCGAAAIAAVAPLIHARKEFTAVSVACIAILGTIGTIIYTLLYHFFGLEPYQYGVFVGSTLHELAHVIAAAAPGGSESGDIAILVKLGRVALLIPVAFILGWVFPPQIHEEAKRRRVRDLPIPWFIFGFLACSGINTLGLIPPSVTSLLIALSVFFLSMAMAGLGLSIRFGDFKKVGVRAVFVGVAGSIALAVLGRFLLNIL